MSLGPAVESQLESGQIRRLDLIRFDLPGKTVGYHRGGRPFTYNGLVYKPNRWLQTGEMSSDLGVAVTTRTIGFSNIPTADPDDAIAQIESYAYQNAPVIIAHLAGDPVTDEPIGILASSIYEIDQVRYSKGAADAKGIRTLSITIDLQPPGRSARGATLVKRSPAEQNFDNDATDTGLEYVAVNANWTLEWGQR
ncbi:DUF2163 domain-containing protein [Limoniibacter endophyticus]|uniref:DUF2163 domain-containing protein n=1 Tax=Limoniibacter endophyticus TaxID=1565040 RepID=A0A8J3GJN6_9HYPH|nr:DUF2163 domain-containing protein [Limoniibacter endophyticus]GHC79336.1 hypothetical protein GCM10010136_31800 [Limoniibacter endophyticus]